MNRGAFAFFFIVGLLCSGYGANLLFSQFNESNMRGTAYFPPDSRATFSYVIPTAAPGENPMFVSAELFPFVDGTLNSSLKLSLTGTFATTESWVSFLFESSFNVTIVKQDNDSGNPNGKGTWSTIPFQTSNGKPGTTIKYLFNQTNTTSGGTYFATDASLDIVGLPYISEPGKRTIIFPFSTLAAGPLVSEGFFTVCAPTNYLLTFVNQGYQTPPSACPSGLSYQFKIDQLLMLVMTFEDSNLERGYAQNQTYGLFFLGVGMPQIVSSFAYLGSGLDSKMAGLESKIDELTKFTKELGEKLQEPPKRNRNRHSQDAVEPPARKET